LLIQRARRAIAKTIGAHLIDEADAPVPSEATDFCAGAFVTLRSNGALRGCIGCPDPEFLLVDVIERCAVSAAISDPRFPALTASEWGGIDLEISVLGPIEPVADIADIVIGGHGVIVEFGRRRGLLLPQVAVEWNWDAAEFVSQTCIKAGLPRDAWRKGARVFRFEAEVFTEGD
jgi:AmmeMemoRadiSam system protein A